MVFLRFISMLPGYFNFTNREKIAIRELSANSRIGITKLAKIMKCSVATANRLLAALTKQFDIRFTLEIDMDSLGLVDRHIITVKFGKKPDEQFLRGLFRDDIYAQDVYLTEGGYDLLLFAAADTPINYIKWETDLNASMAEYIPEMRPSEFVFPQLGYIPLNNHFADFVRKEMKVDGKDRDMLTALNQNSRTSYRSLGKLLGINEATIRYRIFKLVRKGMIRRFTIAVQNPSYGHLLSYFMRYQFNKNTTSVAFPRMRSHYMAEDEPQPLLNGFPMIAPISGSYRSFGMTFAEDKKAAIRKAVKWHMALLKKENVREKHAFITKTIKGLLPLRNLNAKDSYRFIWV